MPKILEFGLSRYGAGLFEEALEEFGLWGEFEVNEFHRDTVFLPWLALNYFPRSLEASDESGDPDGAAETDLPVALQSPL